MLKSKIYLSDEGYGHIVRQRAIIEELRKLKPDFNITIQTDRHFDFAQKNILADHYIRKFNNIIWHKNADGSPDLKKITTYYSDYLDKSNEFVADEKDQFDFLLTDFVYEAFEIAKALKIPAFGISHFTWDWFFAKLYPPPISRKVLRYFFNQAETASALFFPPLTPGEIIRHYKKNAVEVPFIIRSNIKHNKWPCESQQFKILLMDSGAGLMKGPIVKALSEFNNNNNIFFASPYEVQNANSFRIPPDELLIDYVRSADLVVGRPGFNTISECIAMRVPMLLISEAMNPEMEHNISELKKRRLGAFMSAENFQKQFSGFLNNFLDHEYDNLKRNMKAHSFETNGAEKVAKEILNRL